MRYNLYLKRGLLVGPGVTNSACKQTVGNRHKIECGWSKASANALFCRKMLPRKHA